MTHYFNQLLNVINNMDRQQWALVLAAVIIAGFFLLRGMGSRSSY